MRPKHKTYTIAAAVANSVCLLQTKAGAGALVINGGLAVGGVATFSIARHLSIYGAADEHLITFTIVGTDRYGQALTSAIVGPTAGATVKGTKNFKTITGVSVSGALSGNITIGSADELETPWIPLSASRGTWDMGYNISTGGSMNVAVQTTVGDVWHVGEDLLPTHDALGFANGMPAATAMRLKINAHVSGNVSLDILSRRG